MNKKLAVMGIIVLILGSFLIVLSKESVTQIENLLLYFTGHALGTIGLVLVVIVLIKIFSESL